MARPVVKQSRSDLKFVQVVFPSLLLLAQLCVPKGACAQIPGSWQLVYRLPHWTAADISFSDPDHGMLLLDPSTYRDCATLGTADGGNTWIFRPADSIGTRWFSQFKRSSHHSFCTPTAADAYEIASGAGVYVTHDTGNSWQYYRHVFDPNLGYAWLRMFTSASGAAFTTHLSGQAVSITHDSARHFDYPGVSDYVDLAQLGDIIFVDSVNFWASYVHGALAHSTDSGAHWTSDTVWRADSVTISFYNLLTIAETPDPERFFVLFAGKREWWKDDRPYPFFSADFLETQDGGRTWRIDSSIGSARVYKLRSPARNRLWAFAGDSALPADLNGFTNFYGSDTLVYSPDDGLTWYRDTSLGHHLLEMEWPDEKHGYLVAYEDSTLLVYRFVPNDESVKEESLRGVDTVNIFGSPVNDELTFASSIEGNAEVIIYDLLGRGRLQQRRHLGSGERVQLDLSRLEVGYYALIVRSPDRVARCQFIRQ